MSRWLRYFGWLLVVVLILLSVNYFLAQVFFKELFTPAFYFMHLYFIVLVIFAQLLLDRALKERPQRFVVTFMGVMAIKMFLSLAILVLLVYTGWVTSKFFIVNYLILYLAYSVFSVGQILAFQKSVPISKNTTRTDSV